ncbi:MAG: Uma2 family endonuclease, partial [Chloroflexota bacterium]
PHATMSATTPVYRPAAVKVNHMEQRQTALVPRDRQPWPPDDSEESVVGSEYRQRIIDGVRDGLEMAAGASWHVHSQVTIGGFRRLDGSPYTMLPDVFVVPLANPHPESGRPLTFAEVGVPWLAVEVLSDTTSRWDLDDRRGKAWSYAEAGVAEYIAVDYARRYMSEPVRALRLGDGGWAPWPISPAGRWESVQLGVSFAFNGLYLRVYDVEGRLQPLPHES